MTETTTLLSLHPFEGISLVDANRVSLMNRMDTKFTLDKSTLNQILPLLQEHYFVLEIDERREMRYESLYFDDSNYRFYLDHHRGRTRRAKVRIRNYVDSNLFFLEIKCKNKGRTHKVRVPTDSFHNHLTPEEQRLVNETLASEIGLQANLSNGFKRITMIGKTMNERLTLDYDLRFTLKEESIEFPTLVVAELKQERINRLSPFYCLMKSHQIRPNRLSKYCIGIMELMNHAGLKYNRFKSRKQSLKKLNVYA